MSVEESTKEQKMYRYHIFSAFEAQKGVQGVGDVRYGFIMSLWKMMFRCINVDTSYNHNTTIILTHKFSTMIYAGSDVKQIKKSQKTDVCDFLQDPCSAVYPNNVSIWEKLIAFTIAVHSSGLNLNLLEAQLM